MLDDTDTAGKREDDPKYHEEAMRPSLRDRLEKFEANLPLECFQERQHGVTDIFSQNNQSNPRDHASNGLSQRGVNHRKPSLNKRPTGPLFIAGDLPCILHRP